MDDDEMLLLSEAAELYGVNLNTLRSRASSGKLKGARQVESVGARGRMRTMWMVPASTFAPKAPDVPMLTLREASDLTGFARVTLQQWAKAGLIRGAYQVGKLRTWLIPEGFIEEFTEDRASDVRLAPQALPGWVYPDDLPDIVWSRLSGQELEDLLDLQARILYPSSDAEYEIAIAELNQE